MKKTAKPFLIFLIFLLFFISCLTAVQFKGIHQTDLGNNSVYAVKGQTDDPIDVNGNYWLGQNATSGYGNVTHPYIIEDLVIDARGKGAHGIRIVNTDAYFIVRNCSIRNTDDSYCALYLTNVSNALITTNRLYNNYDGIYHEYFAGPEANNNITHNSITFCRYGIYAYQTRLILNNMVFYCSRGMVLEDSHTLINNTCNYNTDGIFVGRNNQLINNTANFNTDDGIYSWWSNNTLINNTASFNGWNGFYLDGGWDHTLISNTATFNGEIGFYLEDAMNSRIINNTANWNGDFAVMSIESGIFLWDCTQTYLFGNHIEANSIDGLRILSSTYNTLINNSIISSQVGMKIYGSSNYGTIAGNNLTGNELGILSILLIIT